jgi:hypothetical protein
LTFALPPSMRGRRWQGDLRANDTDLVIIDTGRDSNNAGYTAAQAADLVLALSATGQQRLKNLISERR